MKGRKVKTFFITNAGSNDKFKLSTPLEVKIIEVIREKGTDIMFFNLDGELKYITAKDIVGFL